MSSWGGCEGEWLGRVSTNHMFFLIDTGGCPIINIPGFTFPVQDHYLEDVLKALP